MWKADLGNVAALSQMGWGYGCPTRQQGAMEGDCTGRLTPMVTRTNLKLVGVPKPELPAWVKAASQLMHLEKPLPLPWPQSAV